MAEPAKRRATYADLQAVPPHLVAEIIDGALLTRPRPMPRHAAAANALSYAVTGPYQMGLSGPGGWVFLTEPELHLGKDVLAPDRAGWRRERLSVVPDREHFKIAPDWVCEILSPSTEHVDRGRKRVVYARHDVPHLWLVDPSEQVLEAFSLTAGQWLLSATFSGGEQVSAPPFEGTTFPLAALWPFDAPLTDDPQGG